MPTPGDRPDSVTGFEPTSLCLLGWQAGSLALVPPAKPPQLVVMVIRCLFLHQVLKMQNKVILNF